MLKIVLISLGMLVITATALPVWKKDAWWVRIFDFPRLQITILSAVILGVYLGLAFPQTLPEFVFFAALAASVIFQVVMMFPYTPIARKQVEASKAPAGKTSVSLLFANVLETNRKADQLKRIIREADPDIILTVETNGWWRGEMSELEAEYPHTVLQPQDNTYGMLLHSRLELIDPQVKFLVQDDIPSIHVRARLRSGDEITLRCLHPRPPFPTENDRSIERDVELVVVGKEVKALDEPVIVLGDLNDVAWSHTNYLFQNISGLLDPRIGRGFFHTFHAEYPFMRFPLDHFFHSNHFRLVDFRRLEYFGSDHFPVFITLSLEPTATVTQEELTASKAQQEEADEKASQDTKR